MCKFIVFAALFYSSSAFAYLDPGTGSIIIQSAIAAIAGFIFTVKLYWYRIKSWFSRKLDASAPEQESAEHADETEQK